MTRSLKDVLELQLRAIAENSAKKVHEEFKKQILKRNFALEYRSLDKQGDLFPLIPGKRTKNGTISVPDAIAIDVSIPRILWTTPTRISVFFGNKSELIKMSPQIMWYEFGYSGQKSLISQTQSKASGFINGSISGNANWYWISKKQLQKFFTKKPFKSFGRYDAGLLIKGSDKVFELVEYWGGSPQPVGPIPAVRMYGKAFISLKQELPKIFKNRT